MNKTEIEIIKMSQKEILELKSAANEKNMQWRAPTLGIIKQKK